MRRGFGNETSGNFGQLRERGDVVWDVVFGADVVRSPILGSGRGNKGWALPLVRPERDRTRFTDASATTSSNQNHECCPDLDRHGEGDYERRCQKLTP